LNIETEAEDDQEDEKYERKIALLNSTLNASEFDFYNKDCKNPPQRVKEAFDGYESLGSSFEVEL
jgi:hypothetical protein